MCKTFYLKKAPKNIVYISHLILLLKITALNKLNLKCFSFVFLSCFLLEKDDIHFVKPTRGCCYNTE